MVELLTGENNYDIRARRSRKIVEFGRGKSSEAVSIVDGTAVTADELPQLLLGVSLFAPERLVVLDDANSQKPVWEKLLDFLPQVGEGTDVLLVTPGADKRTKTYKWLQKNAMIQQSPYIQGLPLERWVQAEAAEVGVELAPRIAKYIIEYTGGDQWQLKNDITKLSLSGQAITVELVRELLIPNTTSSAFDLLDAALHRRKQRVNELLAGVRAHEDPYLFLGLLSSQIFAILVIATAGVRSAHTIAQESGLHPYVIEKMQPLARRLSLAQSKHLAEVVATTDMQIKTSGQDPWVLITAALKNIAA